MARPVDNPPNPWSQTHVEWLEPPPPARLEVFEEDARSIITENDSPDVGFRYSVNPYRGCSNACAYCYARPSHQYLGFGAGTDFDRKIVVKRNAPELLRKAFERPSWKGDFIAFSGNTDCYQALEASYQLTRGCLEVCAEYRNPVGVITKGLLIRRDIALLARLARETRTGVYVSIPFASDEDARRVEPYASAPSQRFETLKMLSDAGIPCGVAFAPVIPGLNDAQIPEVLARARAAGARKAFMVLLRLAAEVRPVFEARLEESFPERAKKVRSLLMQSKGGVLNRSEFGARMVGTGPVWEAIRRVFALHCARNGLAHGEGEQEVSANGQGGSVPVSTFRRPPPRQGSLF